MTDATGQQTAGGSTVHARSVEIESFIEHDYRRVVGSVALVTGDRAHAEDAVQDALVNAWRRRDEPIERLAGWVTVVASNTARSRHRRHRAERRALDRAGRGAAEQIADAEPFDAELERALEGLPRRERQAAVLHYVLDMSVTDCGVVMGVAEGTIKTLLFRARGHLRTALHPGDAGIDEGDVA